MSEADATSNPANPLLDDCPYCGESVIECYATAPDGLPCCEICTHGRLPVEVEATPILMPHDGTGAI